MTEAPLEAQVHLLKAALEGVREEREALKIALAHVREERDAFEAEVHALRFECDAIRDALSVILRFAHEAT
jgi:uncharacterized coiled-coil DUF342 family protein